MRRINGFGPVATAAMAAAMFAGVFGLSGMALAQAPEAAQAPATAPAAAAPAAPPTQAPSATDAVVPAVAAEAQGGTIKGTVKASGVPLPGVAVTATNSLTGKKYATTTDVDGAYEMSVPRNGRYVVKTDLAGFSSETNEVVVNASSANGGLPAQTAEFKLDLASRVTPVVVVAGGAGGTRTAVAGGVAGGTAAGAATTAGATTAASTAGSVARVGRGTQVVAVQSEDDQNLSDATAGQVNLGEEAPSLDDSIGSGAGADAVAVTGQQGVINGLATFSQDDLQNRIQDMRQNGFTNGDIAGTLTGVMSSGIFPAGPGGPGGGLGEGGGPGGGGPGGGGGGGGFGGGGGGGGGFGGGGGGGGGFGGGGGGGGGRGGGGGGGGFGGGGFGGGFGGFRGQNPNAWHGSVAYTGSDNALNADSYSVTGRPVPKPDAYRNTLIASFTGTPYITGLIKPNPKQFLFLSVQKTLNRSPSVSQIIVPTYAQELGDLSPASQAQLTPAQQAAAMTTPILYYDPNPTYKNAMGNIVTNPGYGMPYGPSNASNPCSAQLLALYPNSTAPTACIPASELSAAGQALLGYYPAPNITATQTGDNYQTNVPGTSGSSQISARYNRSFGAAPVRGQRGGAGGRGGGGGGGGRGANRNAPPVLRQSIAENFAYSHSASANSSFSPLLGGKSNSNGYSFTTSYTVGYGRINSTASLGWNRSRSQAFNYFTNGPANSNPATLAGIKVGDSQIYGNSFYFGLPSVGVTGLAGLSDTTPSNSVNQTISFSDFVSWSHKKHNMRVGVDFRRIHADSLGGTNVLGSFTFSGYSTENPLLQACNPKTDSQGCKEYPTSGSSLADLLLGLPQQTAITAGLSKIYLRGNSWDWYAQDDWRAKANFTVSYGLRWEYFSPYSEKYNHLVNLNLSGSGSGLQIANVCATAATGCASVGSPASLVNPDKALYSPRIAIAWVPKVKFASALTKNIVVRSGYGINYNTGAYSRFASKMSFQQPFAITQTNTLSTPTSPTTCTPANMSLNITTTIMNQTSTGFNCSTQTTQSNFAVDPNYRLGMVQVYNLGVQKTLPQGIVLNIDYTGAYAFNQDMVRAPNRNALGVLNSSSGQFTYEDSLGYQRSNALAVNLRERMHKGISLQGTYTYSHSIDDASSVGGSGGSIAQDDQNLGAEESNSSFDRRNSLSGNFVIEPPFGPNRAFLNKGGVWAKIMDGYSISGNFTFASGGFATPQYSGTPAEIAAGAGSSLRPNRVPGQQIKGAGTHLAWFNTAAFAAPAPGFYGNASRNSIELPGTVALSGSLSRTISFGETRSLEARLSANNALNTVQYSQVGTQINSSTYGEVTQAAGMRSFTYTARYRF